jgi:hypothetical protein
MLFEVNFQLSFQGRSWLKFFDTHFGLADSRVFEEAFFNYSDF